jgi:hypothetical protein
MKVKTIYLVAISLFFVMASFPLYASEYSPTSEPTFTVEKWVQHEPTSESEGAVSSESLAEREIGEKKNLCFYEWETEALGDRIVTSCVHPRQNYGGG